MGKQKGKQRQITFEDLATMVQNGFMEMDQGMNNRFDAVDLQMRDLKHRVVQLERGQEEILLRLSQGAYQHEFNGLEHRVDHIERFLKLKK